MSNKGQALVEILVAMGIAAIILPAVFTGFITSREGRVQSEARFEATNLAREAGEALRVVREAGWLNISTNGIYHPVASGNTWVLSTGPEVLGEFTRSIEISDLTPVDPSIKKVTITVSWSSLFQSSVVETYYLSRYLDNTLYIETTAADFTSGTKVGTIVTNNAGGEIQLAAGGKADWCAPDPAKIVEFNLDKSGVANAISAIEGRVFAGTGNNASGPAFDNVGISNSDPPVGSLLGNFGSNPIKTNGIFGETNYGYLATDTNKKQGVIVDLTNLVDGQYSEAGSLDIGVSSVNGRSIYVVNNFAYLSGTDGKIYAFDITNKSGVHSPTASTDLGAVANKIIVVGSNLYAALSGTTNQLEVVSLTNGGASFGPVTSFSVGGQGGVDIYVSSTGARAYLATSSSSNQDEFFIVDTDPNSATYGQTKGSYDTNGMDPKGVTVVPGNKAIIVGTGGTQQYQVIDIATESSPVHCTAGGKSGGLVIASGVNGVSSVLESDGDAYSYIVTGDAAAELKIVEGGPGGKFATDGTFESQTFDADHEVSFNRYFATLEIPPGTSAKFQFAGSPGPCTSATFSFVGPDNTGNTFHTTDSGPLALVGQCFRYKAFLSSNDPNQTPVLEDVTVNYSP